jgi:hypothetical protein
MFTKKFLESHFTPLNIVTSRQKTPPEEHRTATVDTEESSSLNTGTNDSGNAASLLSRHKGKLAVGAAAMLGIAAFYHWRESKLAKEDEEEYARLQRLKAALDADESTPKR